MSAAESSSSSAGLSTDVFEDIDDYIWENEGNGSLPWDAYSHVYDLVQDGNSCFRDNQFEKAIDYYSRANKIKPGDPIILGNRSTAYIRLSRTLKHRPALASEQSPLNGLDPTIHAELSLKDADNLMEIQNNSVKPYILKANALVLMEKYEMAQDVILSGLAIDPSSNPLQASLRSLEKRPASMVVRRRSLVKPELTDDFDCILCLKLLYEPITTPCGHSFCRSCLFQSMDHGNNKCPLCRLVLFISPRTCAISVSLNSIITKNFPEEYVERKLEHEGLSNLRADLMPLFVMDVVLPCQKIPLCIFEPRYRLMVRRIMEGNRRMGMVISDSIAGSVADFGCEVEIMECEPLPDGRFFIEIESRRRFRILRSWDQDGYRVAEIDWFEDLYPHDGTQERENLQKLTNDVAEFAQSWLRRKKAAARGEPRRLEKLLITEMMMPSLQDPERLSFWVATLSNRGPEERLELLRIRDTIERMKHGVAYLRQEQ